MQTISVGGLSTLRASFRRHMRATNLSPKTIETYDEASAAFERFIVDRGMPTQVALIRREHIESFIESLLERWTPATANNRYRALQAFFRFLLDDGEISDNPMSRMKPPRVPVSPPPVLTDEQLRSLLRSADDKTFDGIRDTAILRLLIDTGARAAEVMGLTVDVDDPDVDLDSGLVRVHGKGRRSRHLHVGAKTVRAMDRYLRVRVRHPSADSPALWLGRRGPMSTSGLRQMVERRGLQGGVGHVHPHMFRHAFSHHWLMNGGSEVDLMTLNGWKSRAMVSRRGCDARAPRRGPLLSASG